MYLGEETTTVVQSSLDTDTIYNSYTSELSIDNIANDLINLIKNN